MTPDQIQKGDGVITLAGHRGIAMSNPFKAVSHFDYYLICVSFDGYEMPIQLESITEVWRNGVRIDQLEVEQQLSLWGEGT